MSDHIESNDTNVLLAFGGEIKALGDGRLGGYLVRFTDAGRPDLTGDFFTPATDFDIEPGDRVSVYYNHGLDATLKRRRLGVGTVKLDDAGVWVEAQLALRDDYERAIYGMAEAGKLGWSSGTLPNLVEREVEGKAARIVTWPLGKDASLTPTPAAGLVLTAVQPLKSWAAATSHLVLPGQPADIDNPTGSPEAVATEDARSASLPAAADGHSDVSTVTTEVLMEEVKATEQPVIDYTALATAIVAAQEAAKPAKSVGFAVEDEADRALKGKPFRTFGEFLMAVKDVQLGQIDDRLKPLRSGDPMDERGFNIAGAMGDAFVGSITHAKSTKAAPTGLGEGLPQAGGFLVGSDRNTAILSRVYENAQLLGRIAMDPVGPNSNGMTYYAEAETSRATGSRRGGVRFYWVAENSAVTVSAPTFREMELKLKKAGAAVYVTEEQLSDTAALESYVMRIMPEEIRFGVEDSIINGNGVGQPLGILNAPCLVSVAKEAGQAADTIVAQNVIKMWSRLWSRSTANAIWIVNQDTFPQLYQMSIAVGTGGVPIYLPPGGISTSPYGQLFGRPVIVHESSATLGDAGDIILADLREYQAIEKGGIQSASSIHVRFLEGETCFRFIYRVDGQPTWNAPLAPFKGATNTVAPFVALAAR